MGKFVKIFLMIIGLAVFVLPSQMTFAQTAQKCCELKSTKENCCKSEDKKPCHPENPSKKSEQNNCANDCAKCHTCSMGAVFHFISPEIYATSTKNTIHKKINFNYEILFFSSSFHNIWQPPKIA